MQTLLESHRSWIQANQSRETDFKWSACIKCGCHGQEECKHAPLQGHCNLNGKSICPCCATLALIEKFAKDMEIVSQIPDEEQMHWEADMLMYQKLKELGYTEGCSIYRSMKKQYA